MQRLLGIAVVTIGPAPEIDPSVAQSALTVLVGVVLVLLGHRSIANGDRSRS